MNRRWVLAGAGISVLALGCLVCLAVAIAAFGLVGPGLALPRAAPAATLALVSTPTLERPAATATRSAGATSRAATPAAGVTAGPGGDFMPPAATPYTTPLKYPVTLDERYVSQPYTVTGSTPAQIRQFLDANGPAQDVQSGVRFDADTRWQLAGNWDWQPAPTGCEVKSATLALTVTMVFPVLSVDPSRSPDVVNGWNSFTDHLQLHEEGHVGFDVKEGRRLRDDFGNFPPAPDCDVLSRQLQARFDQALQTIKTINSGYDSATQHGRSQGAIYPPP